jgi:hypothetical protein
MERFEDGKIEITAADLPSFLYESGTVYDLEDEVTGLFRRFLLVQVCAPQHLLLKSVCFRDSDHPH